MGFIAATTTAGIAVIGKQSRGHWPGVILLIHRVLWLDGSRLTPRIRL